MSAATPAGPLPPGSSPAYDLRPAPAVLPDPASLRAVSVPLGPEVGVDPYALAGQEGILFADDRLALAGRGVAAVLDLPAGLEDPAALAAAQAWLAAVPHANRADHPGSRVTAFGALAFDRSAGGHLVVPQLTLGQDDQGRRWLTIVAPGPGDPAPSDLGALGGRLAGLCHAGGAFPPSGRPPVLTSLPAGEDYARSVAEAVARMAGGTLRKVVLARCVEARFDADVDSGPAVRRLHAQEPSCTIFAFPTGGGPAGAGGAGGGRFLGASPELLVRREGATVHCHPLAGTVGLTGAGAGATGAGTTGPATARPGAAGPGATGAGATGPGPAGAGTTGSGATGAGTGGAGAGAGAGGQADAEAVERFLASAKDRAEHRLVVDEIVAALRPRCDQLTVPDTPSLVRLRTVAHLGTLVRGTLRTGAGSDAPPSVLELLAALHPTPAVGGVPRLDALACIALLEPVPRGHWAGPVGWVDAAGDGQWMIGIRSATVLGRTVRLIAGAGIVAGSDPQAELAETTVKLAPVLDAFAPGTAHLL